MATFSLGDSSGRAAALYVLGTALFGACAVLSFRRHLHVDELSALYSIQLMGVFKHPDYANVELSQVLFAPLARMLLKSSEWLFIGFRWLELTLLYALCISLSCVQRAWPSGPGKARVFFGAVCFGPLWRHGFELRHDMFLAFEIVLLLWTAERARTGRLTCWVASAAALGSVIVQANSSKAFTIWLPGLAFCALLGARGERPWLKALAGQLVRFLPGFFLGVALVTVVLGLAGALGEYLLQLRQFTSFSSSPPYRLHALPLLRFAIERAPVHAAFVLLGLCSVFVRIATRKELGSACAPFALFCLSGLALGVNPTPFPYNLTWLSPAWLAMSAVGAAHSCELLRRLPRGHVVVPLGGALAAVLALNAFLSCETDPYYRKNWDSQLRVIAAAEALTARDEPVLDLTGLVLTRPPVAKDWIVHSLFMPAYHAGLRETVRHIMLRVWPPVVVTVYRWGFLDGADMQAFRSHYLRFSDDVWTLGGLVRPATTRFDVHRTGRYQVRGPADAGTVDGRLTSGGDVLWLVRGSHAVTAHAAYALAWVGPGIPPKPPPPANPLFENGELRGQRDSK